MKLLHYKIITGTIKVITGLHIGGSTDSLKIGGIDNPVIKNPISDEPYIPGSSIKGKMRSILEWKEGLVTDGKVHNCRNKDCPVCRIFGTGAEKGAKDKGPTRLIVSDAELTKKSKDRINEGIPVTEDKVENTIDRITARANPRHLERVLPGYDFDLNIVYKVYDLDDAGKTDENLFNKFLLAVCIGNGNIVSF